MSIYGRTLLLRLPRLCTTLLARPRGCSCRQMPMPCEPGQGAARARAHQLAGPACCARAAWLRAQTADCRPASKRLEQEVRASVRAVLELSSQREELGRGWLEQCSVGDACVMTVARSTTPGQQKRCVPLISARHPERWSRGAVRGAVPCVAQFPEESELLARESRRLCCRWLLRSTGRCRSGDDARPPQVEARRNSAVRWAGSDMRARLEASPMRVSRAMAVSF